RGRRPARRRGAAGDDPVGAGEREPECRLAVPRQLGRHDGPLPHVALHRDGRERDRATGRHQRRSGQGAGRLERLVLRAALSRAGRRIHTRQRGVAADKRRAESTARPAHARRHHLRPLPADARHRHRHERDQIGRRQAVVACVLHFAVIAADPLRREHLSRPAARRYVARAARRARRVAPDRDASAARRARAVRLTSVVRLRELQQRSTGNLAPERVRRNFHVDVAAYTALMQRIDPDDVRATAMGRVRIAANAATLVASFVGGAVLQVTNDPPRVFAAAGLISMAGSLLFLAIRHDEPMARPRPASPLRLLPMAWRDATFRRFLIASTVFGFANLTAATLFPLLLVDRFDAPNAFVGLYTATSAAATMAGYWFWGRRIDRGSSIRLALANTALLLAVPALYLFAPSIWVLLV